MVDPSRLPFDDAPPPSLSSASVAGGAPDGLPPVRIYTVGQIAAYLLELLDTDPLLGDLWLSGEVTSLSRSAAGHVYFTLTDEAGALRCAFFRRYSQGVAVQQGDQVLAHGRVSLYLERGDLQFYVDDVQPEGTGLLHAEFQRLLRRLEAEGLFDPGRKRPLPRYPRAIGVVTSKAGAVWHDIRTVTGRRWPLAELVLAPAQVQGAGAAASIVAGIQALNAVAAAGEAPLDVIVVARGGGSLEDLWAFNDETVARAIFASTLPVVSAVGHETDVTIADYVADVRAPTPSAAAELLAPDQAEEARRLLAFRGALGRGLERHAERAKQSLAALRIRLDREAPDVNAARLHVDDLARRGEDSLGGWMRLADSRLEGFRGRLTVLDPTATLARGYAIVEDARGRPLMRAATVRAGDRIQVRLRDGRLAAEVQRVDPLERTERP